MTTFSSDTRVAIGRVVRLSIPAIMAEISSIIMQYIDFLN